MCSALTNVFCPLQAREKAAETILAKALGYFGQDQPAHLSVRNLYSMQLYCSSWAASRKQPSPVSLADHLVVVLQASGTSVGSQNEALKVLRSKLRLPPVPERLHVLASCTPEFAAWALKAYDEWLPTNKRFLVLKGDPDKVCQAANP